jgi:hypothetical protein
MKTSPAQYLSTESTTAMLIPVDSPGKPTIYFQNNPDQIGVQDKTATQENSGANNENTGRPKVSFSEKKATTIELKNMYIDKYEQGESVMKEIQDLKEATTFIEKMRRPPVYEFRWGTQQYFRKCFVENLSYKLTMFLPDGTPVRAIVDISLKEADEPRPSDAVAKGAPDPSQAQRANNPQGTFFTSIGSFLDDWFA